MKKCHGPPFQKNYWLMTEDTLTEEEINDGFDGVAPSIFVISTD